jgi:hypothetical protein
MPIAKPVQAENGITINYHRPVHLAVDLVSNAAQVTVNSHATEQAALDGLPVAWQSRIVVPATLLAGDQPTLLAEVENALIALEGSTFFGGQLVADLCGSLDVAKARAWAAIKAMRAVAEEGNFIYDGGSYQADKVRINGAVQLAVLAKANGAAYEETWTLTDNTTRQLNADQVIALGVALGQFVSGIYATGRALRVTINEAETIEAVNAVRWPA